MERGTWAAVVAQPPLQREGDVSASQPHREGEAASRGARNAERMVAWSRGRAERGPR